MVNIDLLELRRVPKGMKDLLVMEPMPRTSLRTRRESGQPREPTAEEIGRSIEEKNADIERENAELMKKRFELFSFFVSLCLPAVLPVKAWEKDHKQKKISDFATATDEGFAMILFVNNSEIFLAMAEADKKTYKDLKQIEEYKDLQPKYTSHTGREVGWTEQGLEHFEELVEGTLLNRKSTDANDATYVDMDSKFFDSVQKRTGIRQEFVLSQPNARKRKRRFTEL